jgi:hypothetical protein
VNRSYASSTPVPPAVLLGEVLRLRGLLDELAALSELGLPPALLALRSDAELALEHPESLNDAENQLDFIEEFADAIWGEPFSVLLSHPGVGERHPQYLREAEPPWEQLDMTSERLCQHVEAWHRRQTVASRSLPDRQLVSPT